MSITISLRGGAANQLFQYGFGLAQARRFKTDLLLDVSSFKNDTMRRYNLDLFRGVTETLVSSLTQPNVLEKTFRYDQELVDSIKDGDHISGYFQCEKYLENVAGELRKKIQPKYPMTMLGNMLAADIISVAEHSTFLIIRRTDYLYKQDFHGLLDMDYYLKALKIIAKKVEPFVLVFSDDPNWVRDNFNIPYPWLLAGSFDQTTSSYLGREDQDLALMAMCEHAVLANSSFSWMGAWLGDVDKPDRVVVGPKQWFTAPEMDSSDVIPSRWISI